MIVDLVTLFAPKGKTDIDKIVQLSLNRSTPHAHRSFYLSKIIRLLAMTKEQGEYRRPNSAE